MAGPIESGGGDGKKRSKGVPPIDMTPMVDLGFLLLTFFILTTTMADPKSMPIVVPADKEESDPEPDKVAKNKVMNIIIAGKDRIYYYMGKSEEAGAEGGVDINSINYGKGIRGKIRENQKNVRRAFPNSKDANGNPDKNPMIAMIKVAKDARYQNVVDILDEMNITRQTKYMLLDLKKEEAEIIVDYEKAEGLTDSSVSETLKAVAAEN